jgi:hypothetical protein
LTDLPHSKIERLERTAIIVIQARLISKKWKSEVSFMTKISRVLDWFQHEERIISEKYYL